MLLTSNQPYYKMTNIAFIDDDRNLLDGFIALLELEDNSWKFTSYTDPIEARNDILLGGIDLVITDFNMPGLNGMDLLKHIKIFMKDDAPEFIIITGMDNPDLKIMALDLNAADLLNKPVSKNELVARIRNAIRLKEKNEHIKAQNKMLESQLCQAQKMELVGMMTAGITHDFKNIMSVIMSYNQLLEANYYDNKNILQITEKVQKISEHGIKMLRQILDFVKDRGEITETICLNSFIQESINLIKASISKKISIAYSLPSENLNVFLERTHLFQILMNLVLNAAQAIGADNGHIEIILEKTTTEDGPFAHFKIIDNGAGMDAGIQRDLLKNIHSLKKSKDGTGLGLSVVQRLIDDNKGLFAIESAKGLGSKFSVYLPISKSIYEQESEMLNANIQY